MSEQDKDVEARDEQKLEDLEVQDEKADAVKGGMSELGETESLHR
jgi:hypothetical protein